MKKLTKLLTPIFTASAAAAAIVPLTVACGNNEWKGWVDGSDSKLDDEISGYAIAPGRELKTDADLINLAINYLSDAKDDKSIVTNDFRFSTRQSYSAINDLVATINERLQEIEGYEDASITVKVKDFKGKLSDFSISLASSPEILQNSYYLMNFNNCLYVDLEAHIDIPAGEYPSPFNGSDTEKLPAINGDLNLRIDLDTTYKNILASVKPVGYASYNDPSNPQQYAEIITLLLMGVEPEEIRAATYELPVVYADMGLTINAPEEVGIYQPDWAFSRKGSIDLTYVSKNESTYDLSVHLGGAKSFSKETYDPEEPWGGEIFTDLTLALTGQWMSYYLIESEWIGD